MNIRFPNITGVTEAEQIIQIKSYLHQLVQQLNWVLSTIESGSEKTETKDASFGDISAEKFYELKSLLVKSSEMLNVYYEKINSRLEQHYLKKDAFDEYVGSVTQMFEGLDEKYASKADFDDLGNQYVSQDDYEAYKQELAPILSGMVLATDFDAYKQEIAENIALLQQQIDALKPTN
jgi:hypothetical protein